MWIVGGKVMSDCDPTAPFPLSPKSAWAHSTPATLPPSGPLLFPFFIQPLTPPKPEFASEFGVVAIAAMLCFFFVLMPAHQPHPASPRHSHRGISPRADSKNVRAGAVAALGTRVALLVSCVCHLCSRYSYHKLN